MRGSGAGAPSAPADVPKLYLLVRRDLSWSARSVQAAHAAVALSLVRGARLTEGGPHGPPIVLLGVEGERDLEEWLGRLGEEAVPFREPDLGDVLTAVAYWGPALPAFGTLRLL